MKAKELAKFLLENPEAEVIFKQYVGIEIVTEVKSAQLYSKGQYINDVDHKCKVESVYLSMNP